MTTYKVKYGKVEPVERFTNARGNDDALREAVDEFMTNYVSPQLEHFTDAQYNEVEEAAYEIMRDLVLFVQKKELK